VFEHLTAIEREQEDFGQVLPPRVIYVNPDVPDGELIYHYGSDGRMVIYIHPKAYYSMLRATMHATMEISFSATDATLLNSGIPIVRESAFRYEWFIKERAFQLMLEDNDGEWPSYVPPHKHQEYWDRARESLNPWPYPSRPQMGQLPKLPGSSGPANA
jgi:hypothetical protein